MEGVFTKFRCRIAGGISRENGGNTRENGGNTRETAEIPGNVGYMLLRKHHEGLCCCQSASGDSSSEAAKLHTTPNLYIVLDASMFALIAILSIIVTEEMISP